MGLSVDTSRTFEYVFIDERSKPAGDQRALTFKYVSSRTFARIRAIFGEANDAPDDTAVIAKVTEGILLALVGWRNMVDLDTGEAVAFDSTKLEFVTTRGDICELWGELLETMTLSEAEKKRHGWRSLATTGKSASQMVMANVSPDAPAPSTNS